MGTKYIEDYVSERTADILTSDENLVTEPTSHERGAESKRSFRKALEYYFDRKRLRKDLTFFS